MDIVDRLRQGLINPSLWDENERVMRDAADEIERLRAALRRVVNAAFLDLSFDPDRSAVAIARAALEQNMSGIGIPEQLSEQAFKERIRKGQALEK